MPFTHAQFFDVMAQYNVRVWPTQWILLALACAVFALVLRGRAGKAAGGFLALLWAWMGIGYHLLFFTQINPAAWLFGGAFVIAAVLFAFYTWKGSLEFDPPKAASGAVSLALFVYAILVYPLLGFVFGQRYPAVPTFGLPCPTTILTFAFLLLARRPAPKALYVVPVLWAMIGTSAAVTFGVLQDFALIASVVAVGVVTALEAYVRRSRASRASHPSLHDGTGARTGIPPEAFVRSPNAKHRA